MFPFLLSPHLPPTFALKIVCVEVQNMDVERLQQAVGVKAISSVRCLPQDLRCAR